MLTCLQISIKNKNLFQDFEDWKTQVYAVTYQTKCNFYFKNPE